METRLHFLLLLLLAATTPANAHVGSPDVFFQGMAGRYRLFVTIRLPQVIPGVAEIEIRSASSGVREIRIVPLRLTGPGSQYAPTPDLAQPSKDDPQFFTGSLWLMEGGSLQVRVEADGAQGKGAVSIPVPSVAQRILPMQRTLGVILFGLMLLLAAGAVSIAAAAAREGDLEPGAVPSAENRRRARAVMVIAAALVLGVIYLGDSWWAAEAQSYAASIYKPPRITATLEPGGRLLLRGGTGRLTLIPGRSFKMTQLDDLIPDHNHLMHLFLIRMPEMERFWHLHPTQTEPGVFVQELPSMSAGHYQIFADVVHQTGFPETMLGEIDLPQISGKPLAGDDAEGSGLAISQAAKDSTLSQLPDGARMIWERDAQPLRARVSTSFRFRVEDRDGRPAQDLELYMGMPGHAEFISSDCSVFAHVHPAGSVSMAALQLAQASLIANSPDAEAAFHGSHLMAPSPLPPEISFPYGFPRPGKYRVFVQIKRAGRIETGVFDARVL